MAAAIREASKNISFDPSGGPFGACIVKNKKILAVSRNTVLKSLDPTCHAEINAIRLVAKKLKSFDLSGCEIYSTTEPCPMCFGAIHWARISKVHYGTTTREAKAAGFNELTIPDTVLKKLGKSPVRLYRDPGVLKCRELFRKWISLPNKKNY